MRPPRTRIISRLEQMKVLASPVRQELLDVLSRIGPSSLAQLGSTLGRPADGLYYHMRLLQRAGLVRAASGRTRSGRREDLFRADAGQFELKYEGASNRHARALDAIVGSMMRLGIRDFRRAFTSGKSRLAGPSRDLWALRTIGRLEPQHVSGANRAIRHLLAGFTRNARRGRLYAITVLLTPLDRRASADGRRARKERPR